MEFRRNRVKFYGPVLLLAIVLGCIFPVYSFATSFSVDGAADVYGQLPYIGYGLALHSDPTEVLPVDAGNVGYGLFGLFDTGSTRVVLTNSPTPRYYYDAYYLELSAPTNVDVRINSLGATNQLGTPLNYNVTQNIGIGGAEAEVQNVEAIKNDNLDVTLIGAPVSNQVTASIDYTTQINRMVTLYDADNNPFDKPLDSPDIMFNPSAPLMFEVELSLERFGATILNPDGATAVGERYYLLGVSLIEGMDSVSDVEYDFLYDTGSNVTVIGESIAEALGLSAPDFTGEVGGTVRDGYNLTSIEMMGLGGTYTVMNAAVFVVPDDYFLGPYNAILGSNLFAQTSLFFDGPGNILGIGVSSAVPEPATMLLLGTGLVGVAGAARRRKKNQA